MLISLTLPWIAPARSRPWTAIVLFAPLFVGCSKAVQTVQMPESVGGQLRQYTGTLEADDGQWVRATKDYADTRYSTLNQINVENIAGLKGCVDIRHRRRSRAGSCADRESATTAASHWSHQGRPRLGEIKRVKRIWPWSHHIHRVVRNDLADISKGETMTMAPTVVHNKVLVGDSGGEFGVRGISRRSRRPVDLTIDQFLLI
jgi:hypothetical protein